MSCSLTKSSERLEHKIQHGQQHITGENNMATKTVNKEAVAETLEGMKEDIALLKKMRK